MILRRAHGARGPLLRTAGAGVLAARVAYGAALLAAPERMTRSWLGSAGAQPATQVPVRGLGAREVVLFGLALDALLRERRVRPWLVLGVAGDLSDIVATAVASRALPVGAVRKTAAVGGASAVLTAAVARAVDS